MAESGEQTVTDIVDIANESQDNKIANGVESESTNEEKGAVSESDKPVKTDQNGPDGTGKSNDAEIGVDSCDENAVTNGDRSPAGGDSESLTKDESAGETEKANFDLETLETCSEQEAQDRNENANCHRGDEGTNKKDQQNGGITDKPIKQTTKGNSSKGKGKKVSISPAALCELPKEFQAEKEDSKKPDEQLTVLIKTNDAKHLKQFLRSHHWSVGHPIRQRLWLETCKFIFRWKTSVYQEMVDDIFKGEHPEVLPLPVFVDNAHVPDYYLTQKGVYNVHLILVVLENLNPDITFCPLLFPITALFLHFMEPEECFNCLYGMVRSRESYYLAQTKVAVDATHLVMRDLAKHHAKSAYSSIFKDTDGNVEPVFRNWLWWIFSDLPFPMLVQVIDCYLDEGVKVFYRVALAVLILYHKHTGKSRGDSSSFQGINVSTRIKHFCADIPFSVEKLLKTAFGIRGLGKKEVRKLQMRHEMYEKSTKVRMTRASSIARSSSRNSFSGHSGVSYSRSQSIPAPLTVKKSKSKGDTVSQDLLDGVPREDGSDYLVHPVRSRSLSHLNIDEVSCYTINHKDLMTIWGWLPARYTICQPHLLFTSEEHGIALRTIYSKIDHYEPTLIVVKTTRNEVFGAFCSTDWRERIKKGEQKNLSYFGTGETFVFTLSPLKKVYEWVGLSGGNIPATGSMFLAGDHRALTVGGGSGTALHLEDGLSHCRTEKCDTFNNPPLCRSQDFSCKVLEVLGFR